MPVTVSDDCFDVDGPVDPDLDELDDDEVDDLMEGGGLTGHTAEGWEADPRFRVLTADVERAAEALHRVAERFMHVGTSGTEHETQADAAEAEDHTPNNAFVQHDEQAAYVRSDTKGWLSHEMATTMKRILVEELEAAGVDARVEADYPISD